MSHVGSLTDFCTPNGACWTPLPHVRTSGRSLPRTTTTGVPPSTSHPSQVAKAGRNGIDSDPGTWPAKIAEPYGGYPAELLNVFGWGMAIALPIIAIILSLIPWRGDVDLEDAPEEAAELVDGGEKA